MLSKKEEQRSFSNGPLRDQWEKRAQSMADQCKQETEWKEKSALKGLFSKWTYHWSLTNSPGGDKMKDEMSDFSRLTSRKDEENNKPRIKFKIVPPPPKPKPEPPPPPPPPRKKASPKPRRPKRKVEVDVFRLCWRESWMSLKAPKYLFLKAKELKTRMLGFATIELTNDKKYKAKGYRSEAELTSPHEKWNHSWKQVKSPAQLGHHEGGRFQWEILFERKQVWEAEIEKYSLPIWAGTWKIMNFAFRQQQKKWDRIWPDYHQICTKKSDISQQLETQDESTDWDGSWNLSEPELELTYTTDNETLAATSSISSITVRTRIDDVFLPDWSNSWLLSEGPPEDDEERRQNWCCSWGYRQQIRWRKASLRSHHQHSSMLTKSRKTTSLFLTSHLDDKFTDVTEWSEAWPTTKGPVKLEEDELQEEEEEDKEVDQIKNDTEEDKDEGMDNMVDVEIDAEDEKDEGVDEEVEEEDDEDKEDQEEEEEEEEQEEEEVKEDEEEEEEKDEEAVDVNKNEEDKEDRNGEMHKKEDKDINKLDKEDKEDEDEGVDEEEEEEDEDKEFEKNEDTEEEGEDKKYLHQEEGSEQEDEEEDIAEEDSNKEQKEEVEEDKRINNRCVEDEVDDQAEDTEAEEEEKKDLDEEDSEQEDEEENVVEKNRHEVQKEEDINKCFEEDEVDEEVDDKQSDKEQMDEGEDEELDVKNEVGEKHEEKDNDDKEIVDEEDEQYVSKTDKEHDVEEKEMNEDEEEDVKEEVNHGKVQEKENKKMKKQVKCKPDVPLHLQFHKLNSSFCSWRKSWVVAEAYRGGDDNKGEEMEEGEEDWWAWKESWRIYRRKKPDEDEVVCFSTEHRCRKSVGLMHEEDGMPRSEWTLSWALKTAVMEEDSEDDEEEEEEEEEDAS